MEFSGLGFIPFFLTLWCMVWLSVSYTLAITYSHAPPLMYISATGNYYPENITFKIGFIGMANAIVGLMFLQYKFIQLHVEAFGPRQPKIQKILLVLGLMSCSGIMIFAMFENAFFPMVHRIGAFIAFTCSGIYNLWQAIILYKAPGCRRAICHIRTVSCVMALLGILILIGCQALFNINLSRGGNLQISPIIPRITEWLIMLFFLINILTYHQPMQRLTLTVSQKGFTISRRAENQDSGV
ncbi:DNA damage-regulated autophagy modulator protein 1-like [Engystomops pustulosus]|uniref:DNA damage-regulated autophagy modulator protein 1-like n=1 Tax=Engystomops pustulosus TaxID=76066 RepID=UPI003AFACD42